MRKLSIFVAAFVLALGLAQCKKEQPAAQNETEGVRITLNVGPSTGSGTNGSRVQVNPDAQQQVTFTDGDKILVASGGKYVGYLEHNGSGFTGTITNAVQDQKLYFYFLGNKADVSQLTKGTSTACTVNISDQTTTAGLPVISMGESDVSYPSSDNSYTSRLYNKCSLMKFNVDTGSDEAICIKGMNNTVAVNFADPTDDGFSYSMNHEDSGLIKMAGQAGSGVKTYWAIVLPQDAYDEEGDEGTAYSEDHGYTGNRPVLPAIGYNQFLDEGVAMSVNNCHLVDLSGINENYTAHNGEVLIGTLNENYTFSVEPNATITLKNANITHPSGSVNCAGIDCLGDATIRLMGMNEVGSGLYSDMVQQAGIFIPSTNTLTIEGPGSLTIAPSESAGSGGAAGIGAGYNIDCGNIVINGGTLNITSIVENSSNSGAAIGAGYESSCGNITINGGSVTATAGSHSAGIGAGYACAYNSSCGVITINGGTVEATGGYGAAGIGASYTDTFSTRTSSICDDIIITGGTVTANGGINAAGIGSGFATNKRTQKSSTCGNILISGGTVTATGGEKAAGIGSGYKLNMAKSVCGTISITTGVTSVTATKGNDATHSIGKGSGTCGTVTIGCTLDVAGNPVGGTVYWDGSNYQSGGDTYLTQNQIIYQP